MLVVGGLTMAISFIPVWLGIVVCIIVLAITAVAIINASVVSDVVSKVDVNIKTKSHFIRQLTADAQALMVKSTTADTQQITKKVYEVIRYSDPVSNEALDHIEAQIMVNFKEFQNAILKNLPNAMLLGEDLIILIEERNIKCRSLK
jgi:DNA polymerase III delta prime subunit